MSNTPFVAGPRSSASTDHNLEWTKIDIALDQIVGLYGAASSVNLRARISDIKALLAPNRNLVPLDLLVDVRRSVDDVLRDARDRMLTTVAVIKVLPWNASILDAIKQKQGLQDWKIKLPYDMLTQAIARVLKESNHGIPFGLMKKQIAQDPTLGHRERWDDLEATRQVAIIQEIRKIESTIIKRKAWKKEKDPERSEPVAYTLTPGELLERSIPSSAEPRTPNSRPPRTPNPRSRPHDSSTDPEASGHKRELEADQSENAKRAKKETTQQGSGTQPHTGFQFSPENRRLFAPAPPTVLAHASSPLSIRPPTFPIDPSASGAEYDAWYPGHPVYPDHYPGAFMPQHGELQNQTPHGSFPGGFQHDNSRFNYGTSHFGRRSRDEPSQSYVSRSSPEQHPFPPASRP